MANPFEVGKSVSLIDANSVNIWPITSANNLFYIIPGEEAGEYSGEYISPVTGNMVAFCYDVKSNTSKGVEYTRRYKVFTGNSDKNQESGSEFRQDHIFDTSTMATGNNISTWENAILNNTPYEPGDNLPRVVTYIDTKEFRNSTSDPSLCIGDGKTPVYGQKFSVLTAYMTDMNEILEKCTGTINKNIDVSVAKMKFTGSNDVSIISIIPAQGELNKVIDLSTRVLALSPLALSPNESPQSYTKNKKIAQTGGNILWFYNGERPQSALQFIANNAQIEVTATGFRTRTDSSAYDTAKTEWKNRKRPQWENATGTYTFAYIEDVSAAINYVNSCIRNLDASTQEWVTNQAFVNTDTSVKAGNNIDVSSIVIPADVAQSGQKTFTVSLKNDISVRNAIVNENIEVKKDIINYKYEDEISNRSRITDTSSYINKLKVDKDFKVQNWSYDSRNAFSSRYKKYYDIGGGIHTDVGADTYLHWDLYQSTFSKQHNSTAPGAGVVSKLIYPVEFDTAVNINAYKNLLYSNYLGISHRKAPLYINWEMGDYNDTSFWGKSPIDGSTLTVIGDPAEIWYNGVFPIISATGGKSDGAVIDLSVNPRSFNSEEPLMDLRICTFDDAKQRIVVRQEPWYKTLEVPAGSDLETAVIKAVRMTHYSRGYENDYTLELRKKTPDPSRDSSITITNRDIRGCCTPVYSDASMRDTLITDVIEEDATYYITMPSGLERCVINPRQGKPGGTAAPAEAILLDENHNTAFPQRVSSQSIETHTVNADTSITTQDLYVRNLHTPNIDFGGDGKNFILNNGTSGDTIPLKIKFRYPYSNGEGYITSEAVWDDSGYTVTLDTSTPAQQADIYDTSSNDTYINYNFRVSKFGICELYGYLKYSETGGWKNNDASVIVSIPQEYFPKAEQINQTLWSDNSRNQNNRSICIALRNLMSSLKICTLDPTTPFGDLLEPPLGDRRGYFHFTWAL